MTDKSRKAFEAEILKNKAALRKKFGNTGRLQRLQSKKGVRWCVKKKTAKTCANSRARDRNSAKITQSAQNNVLLPSGKGVKRD